MVINDTGDFRTVECEFYLNDILIEKVVGSDMDAGETYILRSGDEETLTLWYNTETKKSHFAIQKWTNKKIEDVANYKHNWSVTYKTKE